MRDVFTYCRILVGRGEAHGTWKCPRVTIIDEPLARRLFPDSEGLPRGRRLSQLLELLDASE